MKNELSVFLSPLAEPQVLDTVAPLWLPQATPGLAIFPLEILQKYCLFIHNQNMVRYPLLHQVYVKSQKLWLIH